jgi:hypothetical protein
VQVDLIGAVHIGEASYYQQLNQLFDQYDVLLYELVAPEGTVVSNRNQQGGGNPISFLQDSMKNFLGMQSQLEKVNYDKPHFVRADMTPEQIWAKMRDRGDTPMTLALSALADALRQYNRAQLSSDNLAVADQQMYIMQLLKNPGEAKRMLARQFATNGALDDAVGPALNQLLIVDRNAEAMRALQKQIAQGKRKIGIFYGAAHLPDMHRRLINDFGMQKQQTEWITAWDLRRNGGQPIQPISLLLNLLEQLDP